MDTIYLDNGATTKLDESVVEVMNEYHLTNYGNASSVHHIGRFARDAVENSRKTIARYIGASPKEIIFTSGGTESNNMAIKGVAFTNKTKGKHIIISKIEHDCVLNSAKWLEKNGFDVTYLDVDKEGFVNPDELKKAIKSDTILVSIIHGNNEIGTIQDLESLYQVCKDNDVFFHTDACQSFTKTEINSEMADLITLNAHKIHGPKGVGALYIKKGVKIDAWQSGGGHEFNKRSGTENVAAIVGFAKATEIAMKNIDENNSYTSKLRDYFISEVLKIPETQLNGPHGSRRLSNNANISFRYIEGESIVAFLDLANICASTGSACSSHTLDASHVMMALEKNHERAHSSIRFSFSKYTTKDEIDFTLDKLKTIVDRLRDLSPLTKSS